MLIMHLILNDELDANFLSGIGSHNTVYLHVAMYVMFMIKLTLNLHIYSYPHTTGIN